MVLKPKVSVIIPAYNAAATIVAALQAVLSQDYAGEVDLVVVDDGSVDQTADIVRSFKSVRYFFQENAGPASARNRGAKEAQGDFLFFTDSDCRPERSWVSKMMHGFLSDDVAVVAGSYGIANPHSTLARAIHEEIVYRHNVLMPPYPRSFGSYNFAVRRAVFTEVGGFDAGYRRASGEDNDLSYKIVGQGWKILFLKDVLVDHVHQENLSRYLKEQYYHGFWRVKMYQNHPQMMTGDGYTFWKDIIEVPLALAHLFLILSPGAFSFLLGGFVLFEIAFGIILMHSFWDGVFAGSLMWLRSFARTLGFLAGGVSFLLNKITNKKKK